MPDKEDKQPSQEQPVERDSAQRSFGFEAQDGEVLKASGTRPTPPSPDPDPGTSEPINKAADLTESVRADNAGDALYEAQQATPPPPPAGDSGEGEA